MSYFKWNGVTIAGVWKKGYQSAQSIQQLETNLLKKGIAVTHARTTRMPLTSYFISDKEKGKLFYSIAKLLKSGILLPNALDIVGQQSKNAQLNDMLTHFSTTIKSGAPFSAALLNQKKLGDEISNSILIAGHETGSLANSFENVASYFTTKYRFKKNIRGALAMPLISLVFFISISSFIFVFIIPRFAHMFDSLGHELPTITKNMISASLFIRSSTMIFFAISFFIICLGLQYYLSNSGKKYKDQLLLAAPFIGSLFTFHYAQQIMHALSLLINSGVPLASALGTLSLSVNNQVIKKDLDTIHSHVLSGHMFSDALASSSIFLPDVIALIRVGEESGTLSQSVANAAHIYEEKLQHSMDRFILFLQPTVIISLGLLVAALILSVYLPVIELSRFV